MCLSVKPNKRAQEQFENIITCQTEFHINMNWCEVKVYNI